MTDEYIGGPERSYVGFERTAKGVIVPRVKVVSGDADPNHLDIILNHARRIFSEALAFAEREGAQP